MPKNKRLYAVANAHLDTQWNWTIQDTIRDCVKNTLVQNFALIERYPNYRFNFEGAFRYKLAKEYYPHLYEQMKKYVKEGRWNVAGSSVDACDANIPSSEGFMRQILLGNGFWEKEFGKTSLDIFLPDCFGFRYALPSIAHHMGLIGFSTQKLEWGVGCPIVEDNGTLSRPMPDDKKPRADLCRWTGPDGGTIFCSLDEGAYGNNFNYSGPDAVNKRQGYLAEIEHNARVTGVPSRSIYYGTGDYGGSPTDEGVAMLNDAIANPEGGYYDVISASSDDIFRDITPEEAEKIPAYRGNLLIPHGYGAMVSHTISKRWNRKNELLGDSAERANSMAKWLGTAEYPQERLNHAWETFLWHQFHDDVTGTSIGEAYSFSYNDYVIALNTFASELTAGVSAVAGKMNTNVKGTPVVVYNAASDSRTDLVRATVSAEKAYIRVFDADGKEVPSQCGKTKDGKLTVLFAASVLPVSCAVYDLREDDCACAVKTSVTLSGNTLENAAYRVTVNENGDIASIFDKKLGKELLKAPITLQLMPDTIDYEYPSWEYRYEDFRKPFDTVSAKPVIEVAENGAAAAALTITREYRGTTYRQTVTLYEGGERVDVDNDVDWYTKEAMLRASFPFTAENPTATFDQGLGAEECGNSNEFPYYQYNVHQWADLTDKNGAFGVAVMNDCKYSMDKPDDNTLRLTLIRTPAGEFLPKSGQNFQDMGKNLFRYSVTSHGAERIGVAAEAENVNRPLTAFISGKHDGEFSVISFVKPSHKEVLVRCVKKEEKGDRLVVRVQETTGKTLENVSLTFLAGITSAVETNGYESECGKADFNGKELKFDMIPYGVRTFALTLEAPETAGALPEQTALPLFFDRKTVTAQELTSMGELKDGISIPAEIYEREITAGGVRFTLGSPYSYNAAASNGQTVSIPEGTDTLYVMATSLAGDKPADFAIDGKSVSVGVQDCFENVGAWEQVVTGEHPLVKQDEIAVRYTHTHDKDGDRLYRFAYIYKYAFDVRGAKTFTLPRDPAILVYAVTAERGEGKVTPAEPLYDKADKDTSAKYHLTVEGAEGDGDYAAGCPILLRTKQIIDGWLFDHWEGEAVLWQKGAQVFARMTAHATEIKAVRRYIGKNILTEGVKLTANGSEPGEEPENVLRADDHHKWCAKIDENGACWLTADLGENRMIDGWAVHHSGVSEPGWWNTREFRLEYRVSENEEWKTADSVTENHSDRTLRDFAPCEARYVRLYITKPAQDGNDHCRIYQLHILAK